MASRLVRTFVLTSVLLMLLGSCKFFKDVDITNPMDPSYSAYSCSAAVSGPNFVISWTPYMDSASLTTVYIISSVVPGDIRDATRDYASFSNSIKHVGTVISPSVTTLNWAKTNSVNQNAVNYFAVVYQSGTKFEGSTIASVP